jgi:Ca2+-binding RTX toxin-like protein
VRRTTLTLVVALVVLVMAGGVALAKTINGDDGRNTLYGTAEADVIRGYGGRDSIHPGGGVDHVYASRGNDYVSSVGDNARDVVNCGPGYDRVNAMPGPETAGDDYISCEGRVY